MRLQWPGRPAVLKGISLYTNASGKLYTCIGNIFSGMTSTLSIKWGRLISGVADRKSAAAYPQVVRRIGSEVRSNGRCDAG